ncbi:GNAT family N-acetyltransferase [Salinibacterium soli]|uniref:GNAT family N-acetyltransferase n=1 Tax=Antiquaquibacter soli TaxID=3064523 RepID=A0ABT9BNY8_9MICO|nr:GNAT family N-acetyltransferase [Protaetiibacter sp. WY-16]MDO7882735.1 GNAT family N-acetyltransferase [Protaetiibacter sp. WY-16]
MATFEIIDRVATAEEHRALRDSVGWSDHIDESVLEASLRASVRGAVAVRDGEVVGMARLVGDGVHYYYVQDVVVHPDHEGDGIASELTARLVTWVAATATRPAFVGLFASSDAEGVYESLGFTTEGATGMHVLLPARD